MRNGQIEDVLSDESQEDSEIHSVQSVRGERVVKVSSRVLDRTHGKMEH